MLRYVFAAALGLAVVVAAGSTTTAQDKKGKVEGKTTTLEGKLVCAKCTLSVEGLKACEHALQVKADGKEVTYYLVKATEKDFKSVHGKVCPAGSDLAVKVTGVVSEKDGKKLINAAKVEPTK